MYEPSETVKVCVPVAPLIAICVPLMATSPPLPGGPATRWKYEPVFVWPRDHSTSIVPCDVVAAFHRKST